MMRLPPPMRLPAASYHSATIGGLVQDAAQVT
jgi:hypothetical protein